MSGPNVEFLSNSSIETIINNIDSTFQNLLHEIKLYLNIDFIFHGLKFSFIEDLKEERTDFINFGITKTYEGKFLTLKVFRSYKKYIKIILLREAYKCFLPIDLQENKIVNIFLNQKVEIDLQNSNFIEDWKEIRRRNVITYEFMKAEFDRLEKFLKQEGSENTLNPFQFFFLYIRKNIHLEEEIKENFYDKIFIEYAMKYTEYTEDVLETIRIITDIFYKLKSYSSLLDYQNYFEEFKKSGILQTNLSNRKFTENMKWINKFLAPAYSVNWPALSIINAICFFKFHPRIEIMKIHEIITQLPFIITPHYSRNSFGIEFRCFLLFPKIYLSDVVGLLEKLSTDRYIIEKRIFIITKHSYTTNLNHFRNILKKRVLINPEKKNYKKQNEIEFRFDYGKSITKSKLQLFDWLLIDRIRYFSVTGLGFERKKETLNDLKSDLLNEVTSQQNLINELKNNLNIIHNSPNLRKKLLNLIDNNSSFGFFYNKQILNDSIIVLNLLYDTLTKNPSIINIPQFQELIKKQGISNSIEHNLILKKFNKGLIRAFISVLFKPKRYYDEKVEEYQYFYNLFKSFHDLKLFNLESIKSIIMDKSMIQKIYESKESKLKKTYERLKKYKITNQVIEQRLEEFLNRNPPIIHPSLLNTFITTPLTKYYPILILKDTLETRNRYKMIKWLFPRTVFAETFDFKSKKNYIYLQLQMPNICLKEKQLLHFTLHDIFQDNIVSFKSYLTSGFQEAFSRKDFYDLEGEEFFYTKDLFEQYYLYVQNTIASEINPISESVSCISRDLWGKKRNFSHLINQLENRISKEHIDLNLNDLNTLLRHHNILKKDLLEVEKFKHVRNEYFFKNYIKKIKFIPSFQSFGFGQYFLYFYPLDLNEIDFKHLLHNSFQKIKYPANIDNSNSFLINFIWPYHNANSSLLNWLTKSKKVIREYCLFFIKKVSQIFHLNHNLSVNEWDLDPNRFKNYIQNILFNPNYKLMIPELKEFNIGDLNISNYFTPESPEFKALTKLYSWKPIDIKSYLGTRNYTMVNSIINLLENKLIFPIVSVKNLDLIEKLYIILPNVKKEHNEKLQKIFSFFNFGFIYEIEGEYYIHGMPEEIKFENGLMIKLYLPDCQLDVFEKLFDLIFDYLRIKHYIILNDLVDGKEFLKSIYGNLDFLESYNPLNNLIWNDKDKIWMNHKLFDGKFEKIYPDLFPEDKMENKLS